LPRCYFISKSPAMNTLCAGSVNCASKHVGVSNESCSFFDAITLKCLRRRYWFTLSRGVCFFIFAYGSCCVASDRLIAEAPIFFPNLGKKIVLMPEGESYFLHEHGVRHKVNLTDRLIVNVESTLDAQALKQLDSKIERVQKLAALAKSDMWLVTFSGTDMQNLIERLQQHKTVFYVQPDILQVRQAEQKEVLLSSKNVFSIEKRIDVNNVRLAIIDDGFNFKHPEFANINLLFEYDADQRINNAAPKFPVDQHGTLVAGVIAAAVDNKGIDGLAPDVGLIAIRQASSWTSDIILAFSVARMMNADIVNSSWVLPFLPEPLYDLLTDWQHEQQPYLIFAAGNNQSDACEVNALSQLKQAWLIGAADEQGNRAAYSNQGSCVSLYAPATFTSTAASGQGYKPFGGTSAATAYVSGVLARELAAGRKPDKSAIQQLLKIEINQRSNHE
jgi:subtilisin